MIRPEPKIPTLVARWLVACWISLACWPVLGIDVPPQTLRYAVDYKGTNAGELEIVISRIDTGYLVKSISHLSLVAQLFLQSFTIESTFDMVNGQPRLLKGREIFNQSGEIHRSFEVDHGKQAITFSQQEQESQPIVNAAWLDADAFPLALIFADKSSLTGKKFLSVSAKRAGLQVFHAPLEESVTVPAGTFSSLKVINNRVSDPSRTITVWLQDSSNPVPLKIISGKQGKQTTMELIEQPVLNQ